MKEILKHICDKRQFDPRDYFLTYETPKKKDEEVDLTMQFRQYDDLKEVTLHKGSFLGCYIITIIFWVVLTSFFFSPAKSRRSFSCCLRAPRTRVSEACLRQRLLIPPTQATSPPSRWTLKTMWERNWAGQRASPQMQKLWFAASPPPRLQMRCLARDFVLIVPVREGSVPPSSAPLFMIP